MLYKARPLTLTHGCNAVAIHTVWGCLQAAMGLSPEQEAAYMAQSLAMLSELSTLCAQHR